MQDGEHGSLALVCARLINRVGVNIASVAEQGSSYDSLCSERHGYENASEQ